MPLFLEPLRSAGFLTQTTMTLCNVGSRKLHPDDDYGRGAWTVFDDRLRIFGFEVDPHACAAANAGTDTAPWTERHFPIALSDIETTRSLYVTNHPMCSSLYEPDPEMAKRFYNLAEPSGLAHVESIRTTTLDRWRSDENIGDIDFLQIDVQGADLDVVKGAEKTLNRCVLAAQVEVLFSPLYRQQPVFRDVDLYMSNLGFTLVDITGSRVPRAASNVHSTTRPGQLLWADAYYIRDPFVQATHGQPMEAEKLLRLGCILDALDFIDIAADVFSTLIADYGDDARYNVSDVLFYTLHAAGNGGTDYVTDLGTYQKLRHRITPSVDAELRSAVEKARSA